MGARNHGEGPWGPGTAKEGQDTMGLGSCERVVGKLRDFRKGMGVGRGGCGEEAVPHEQCCVLFV